MNRLIGAALMIIVASKAYGIWTVKEFEKATGTENALELSVLQVHIQGVAEGYQFANTILLNRKQQPLYCPPAKLALETENYIEIVRRGIKKYSFEPDTPIELILLFGLAETFPCQSPTPHPKE